MKSSNSRLFVTYIIVVALVLFGIGAVVMPFTSPSGKVVVILALSSSFFVFLILIFNLFDTYIKPVRSAIRAADEMAKGHYHTRTYTTSYGEAGVLSNSVNELARSLQEMDTQEKMQGHQLKTVIDNMESGLMLIDERGYVQLINRKFRGMFDRTPEGTIDTLYYDVLGEQSVHKVVQEAFLYEEKIKDSFMISIGQGKRFVETVGAPIYNEAGQLKGAVLVFHDITELKQLEQMRKDFVANVSHELKTPITSIRGFAETLLEGAKDDPELQERFLTIILKESKRIQELVQDLLELSKLENDESGLQMKKMNLGNLFKDIQPIVKQQAADKQIDFLSSIPDKDLTMVGDSDWMKQVFFNIIHNAINYTPSKGKVQFIIDTRDDALEVKVTDTGIGIPEEVTSRVFERFYRVDKARGRHTGGTGLGLAIVKHIVEAHHGQIELHSKLEQGTTLILTFPR